MPPGEVTISGGPYLPSPRFHAISDLVQLTVRVSDVHGLPVRGLQETAFTLLDDGKPQAIVSFAEQAGAGMAPAGAAAGKPAGAPAATSAASPAARSIELYFDDLHTSSNDMQAVRKAAVTFVQSRLQPYDRVGVFTGSMAVTSGIGLDRAATLAALARLSPHLHMSLQGDIGDCPRITPDQAYMIEVVKNPDAFVTALAQADQCNCVNTGDITPSHSPNGAGSCGATQVQVVHAAASAIWLQAQSQSQATLETIENAIGQLAMAPPPRLLVIGSAGFLMGTFDEQIRQLVQSALREDVVIDALDAKGLVVGDRPWGDSVADISPDLDPLELEQALQAAGGVGPDVQAQGALQSGRPVYDITHTSELLDLTDGMAALARGTGGQLFWNDNDLAGGFQQVTAPAAAYLLTFAPAADERDGKFHALQVKVADPAAAHIRTRSGYFADAGPAAAAQESPLDTAMLGEQRSMAIPAQVATQEVAGTGGAPALRIGVAMDINRLPFQQQNGRSADTLTFAAVLFNAAGEAVAGEQAVMQLRLDADSLAKLVHDGIHTSMTLSAAPGSYRLRQVVREGNAGLLSVRDYPVTLQ